MSDRWRMNRFKLHMAIVLALLTIFLQNLSFCWSLNSEGLALLRFREGVVRDPFGALSNWYSFEGDIDPCYWSGVECSNGNVVVLNLKDLCLEGTLAPELGKLAYIKSIILRNNSFFGNIPAEIGGLKELEVLDLGHNNFSGPFPSDLGNNLSLSILLLDNNNFLGSISSEVFKLKMLSEVQVDESQLTNAASGVSCSGISTNGITILSGDAAKRKLLDVAESPKLPKAERDKPNKKKSKPSSSPSLSPALSPSKLTPLMSPADPPSSFPPPSSISSPPESPFPKALILPPSTPPIQPPSISPSPAEPPMVFKQPAANPAPLASPPPTPWPTVENGGESNRHMLPLWSGVIGGSLFVVISVVGVYFCRSSKLVTVKPWATGLSGQLQKAFVTGVPKLQRSELVTACEDFSNIIGTLSDGTVYKGTLSSGVEIAVASVAVKSIDDWTRKLEAQFRKKIETLSKVNHKNFVNLIGFCEEEQPFTRMMVFEYAPNGTLFEHLHIKEAEHLDWGMRLRIAMGMAYCLEHMHQLNPPMAHQNLQSSSIYLTEDYAAKISDFSFWNEVTASTMGSTVIDLLDTTALADPESNVYSFGLILFEMITGKLPYFVHNGSLSDCASEYLKSEQPLREMVDPTLKSYKEEELEELFVVIKNCIIPNPERRPTMREVAARLKEITTMGPESATPKLSPLWWAELEILSTEAI